MKKKRNKNKYQGVPQHSPNKETQLITDYGNNIILQIQQKASIYQSLIRKGFSEEAANDLISSGLSLDIIQEAGIQPPIEKEIIEKYHIHIVDKQSRIKKHIPLYIIPYPVVDIKDQGKMVRVKVNPNPTYLKIDESIKDTKYLQPSKEHLHYGSHLYILPSEIEKLKSPRCHLILVEGEKKTLKVIQEIRKIEDQIGKYAVIGISGIYNWLNAPEWDLLNIRGKRVILFFDADSENNTAVVEAEIQLAGFLYDKGASQILSATWDIQKGKGIDDYLTQEPIPEESLKKLIENAEDTIKMYREEKRIQDRDIVRNFFLRVLEKKPNTNTENLSVFLQDIGIKKSIIQTGIKTVKAEIEEQLIEKYQQQIQEIFGVPNIKVPDGFLWEEGYLKTKKGHRITEFFIVKSIVEGINNTEGIIIKTITGKEIFISSQEKELKQLFLKHGVFVGDATLWLVSEYIKEYIYENQASIEKIKYANQVGWNGNQYISPQTTNEYIFDPTLEGYTASGDREKEKETVKKILEKGSILGLGYLGAVASLLIKPLENVGARNFIVFLEGTAGQGKTTTAKFGLSLFGNPEQLMANVNTTSTGAEILFSLRKDSLIILDELNTGGQHNISEHIVKLIYDFESGRGKTRGTVKLNLRQNHTYRGVLFFTSENSLNNLVKKSEKTAIGAYRRSIIINYSDKNIDKEDIQTIYDSILRHHGNLLQDITDYILKNTDFLKDKYIEYRKQLSIYKFKGQENHFALLYLAIHILEDILNTNLLNMTTTLHQILEENSEDYKEITEITEEKIQQSIQNFIAENNSSFPNEESNHTPNTIYGKIEGNTLYITLSAFQKLSDFMKIDAKSLKKLLVSFGMAETDENKNRLLKKTTCRIKGKTFDVFKIQLKDNHDQEDTIPP